MHHTTIVPRVLVYNEVMQDIINSTNAASDIAPQNVNLVQPKGRSAPETLAATELPCNIGILGALE